MKGLRDLLNRSPLMARVAPFIIFLALTWLQGKFGTSSTYWVYELKTVIGAFLVWAMWPLVLEMRWAMSWEAVVTGIAIFFVWVFLDPYYPHWGSSDSVTNPFQEFGAGSMRAWFYIGVHVLGMGFVVPPLEEAFYRSFVYRYIIDPDITKVPLNRFDWRALLITATIFGVSHHEWLGGILCGLAFQALVLKKNRLGDAMTAHAITNILLGLWIVWKGDWKFW